MAALAGCGSAPVEHPPRLQVARVDWTERGLPRWAAPIRGTLVFHVSTIRVGPHGWRVTGSLENRTDRALAILPHGHDPEPTGFGVEVGESGAPLIAERFRPRAPRVIPAGSRWSGSFSGPQAISAGSSVRVVYGQLGILYHRTEFVTDHAYRVR